MYKNKNNKNLFSLFLAWGLILWLAIDPNSLRTHQALDIVIASMVLGLIIVNRLLEFFDSMR